MYGLHLANNMNALILALVFFQTLPIVNEIRVADAFTAAIEYGTSIDPFPETADTVMVIPSRFGVQVVAHYGLSGTEFHAFERGDSVSLYDAQGVEHRFALTRSWTIRGNVIDPRRLSRYAIVFVTCTDETGTGLLMWAGKRTP